MKHLTWFLHKYKKMPKPIAPSDKEIILKVKAFFEEEKRIRGPLIPYQKVHERVAAATGVSLHTVSNIVKEGAIAEATSTKIGALNKIRKIRKDKIQLDDHELNVIRNKVQNFYTVGNEFPSLKKLLNVLREEIQFKGSREVLRQYLQKMGFKYKKTKNSHKWVMVQRNPILVKPSVVTDNATSLVKQEIKLELKEEVPPYYKVPNTNSNKNEIIQWLQDHNIEYTHDLTRAQLLKIVKGCADEYVHNDRQPQSS